MKRQIHEQAVRAINAAVLRQDTLAKGLGVLLWEFEEKKRALLPDRHGAVIDLRTIGALVSEFEDGKRYWMEKINGTRKVQQQIGEDALRDLGLDPAKEDYVIDQGRVLKLVAGKYIEDF